MLPGRFIRSQLVSCAPATSVSVDVNDWPSGSIMSLKQSAFTTSWCSRWPSLASSSLLTASSTLLLGPIIWESVAEELKQRLLQRQELVWRDGELCPSAAGPFECWCCWDDELTRGGEKQRGDVTDPARWFSGNELWTGTNDCLCCRHLFMFRQIEQDLVHEMHLMEHSKDESIADISLKAS